jgi:bacterioferritin-associated ferredoxin
MIVCLCKAVNDRAVRAARDAGADTVEAIGAATGAGTCCGGCKGTIAAILVELRLPGHASRAEAVPLRAAADRLDTP